ncbi:MAG: hypothetical protein E7541_00575 [Ruminococcaceae bacterium]|nr:hypothetical protein [Oscillospiraceae bacterium]
MVYVTGDIHGDPTRLNAALRPLRKGDTLLVCGDFGFIWDGSPAEQKRLQKIGKLPYTVAFLDGRHENFDLLDAYPVTSWQGGQAQIISGQLVHLMRGEIYTVEGHTLFTFGGGESDDREFRQPGVSWWPREVPSEEEMHRALDNLTARDWQVDYVCTHVPTLTAANRMNPRRAVDGVSLFLGGIEQKIACKRWYFASLHRDQAISDKRRAVFEDVVAIDYTR